MVNAKISGIASYVPDDILDNEMLSNMVDTSDEWITTRVGVKERRILHCEGKGSGFLGTKAVNKLIAEYGIDPDDSNIRIAPTYPSLIELEAAINIFCTAAKVAACEVLMK